MRLRPYQSRAVDFVLPRRRGFVVAPAGAGKTVIAATASKRFVAPLDRVVWLANTRDQCDQARKAAEAVGWPETVTLDVHCVAARPDITGADLVIIDESHHLPAATWWQTVFEAQCAVWGFSATPWTGDWERDGVLKAFFGEENFITIPREEVLASGSITKGIVYAHDVDCEGEFAEQINEITARETAIRARRYPRIARFEHERRARWQATVEAVVANENRNARICAIANSTPESVLILVGSIEHGERLTACIPGAAMVYAKLGKKKRTATIDAFRKGELRVMVATSLADEGLDVPRASVLILAAGGRSAGKLEQRAGRVMRPHEGKEFGIVHDFKDRGAPLAHNQFKARARTYKRLGYKIHDHV
jgi:superfamily II DNA or RNA helicase